MSEQRTNYLPAIDGLRAFAVGAVLLFHSDHLSGGFLGVDAFFVVSGFLITRQMLQEVDRTGRIALREFWSRRARRLLPALLLLLSVVTAIAYRFGLASERFKIRDDAPWALGFALNWHHIAASTDYWTSLSSPSPLTHVWSLAVEEQFYLVWPLVMVLLIWRRRNRERTVLVASLIGAALSFGLMAYVFEPGATTRAYEGTDTRIGALLIGAACATSIVSVRSEQIVSRLGRWTGIAVLAPTTVLAWMWLRVDGRNSWLYHGGFLLHAVLFAALLLVVSSQVQRVWLAHLLTLRPMRWFGTLSYGLYLWHWPIYIALSPDRLNLSRWPLTAVRLAATVVAATVSYYAVERPVRYGLQRRPVTRTALLSVAGIAIAAVAIVVIPLPESHPAPIDLSSLTTPIAAAGATATTTAGQTATVPPTTPATTPVPTTVTPTTVVRGSATTPVASSAVPTATSTTTSATTSSTSTTALVDTTTTAPAPLPELHQVLWLGDSIAFTTSLGFIAAMKPIGVNVVDSSFPGVGLLNATGPSIFAQIAEKTAAQKPDLLIWQLSTWDEPYGEDAIYGALGHLRDLAVSNGSHLLLIPPPPLRADHDDHGFIADRNAAARLAADDSAHVAYLETTPFWGPKFVYDLDSDHVPERMSDGVHLCPSGSARFAIWLTTQLETRYSNLSVADPAIWAVGEWTQDPRYDRVHGGCSLLP